MVRHMERSIVSLDSRPPFDNNHPMYFLVYTNYILYQKIHCTKTYQKN